MQKPANVQVIGILVVISGAINIIVGLGITLAFVFSLVGLFCLPVALIPVGIGIYELVVGIRVLNNQPPGNLTLVGGLEIASILWGNFLSMIGGIVVLVFYNEPETKNYFDDLQNGTLTM